MWSVYAVEVGANVAEDDGVEHDIFVGSTGEGDLWDRECDALSKRGNGTSAEGGFEFGWARVLVIGDQRITLRW